MKLLFGCVALTVPCLAVAGCHNEPSAATGGAGGAAGASAASTSDKDCPPEFTIDDCEDNNNQVKVQKGRNGYWYTFVDKQGSTISPPAGTKFIMSPGGAAGSQFAARMMGKMSATGDPLYAGLGFSLTNPKGQYDASAFTGVSFYAKVGANATKSIRLKLPDVNTDPDGKVCTECFNDFGSDLSLTDQWQKYTISFDSMSQMEGWGAPHPRGVDKSKLYGMQWQTTAGGAEFDLWIDNVQFTGCP